jgi:translocation and assembly module TamB
MEKFMKKSTAAALFLSPAMILGFISLFWIYSLNPYLKKIILEKIPEINASQPYIRISIKNMDLSILKLQAKVDDITIEFKSDSPQSMAALNKINLGQAKIQFDIFRLMVGQLSFSNLILDHLKTEQNLSALLKLKKINDKTTQEILLHDFFKILDDVPLQKITLQNSDVILNIDESQNKTLKSTHTHIQNLTLAQSRKSISIVTHDLVTQFTNYRQATAEIKFHLNAKFDEKTYTVNQLAVHHGSSKIEITSTSKDLPKLLLNPNTETAFNISLKLDELKELIYQFKEQSQRLPQISGLIKLTGQISTTGLQKNTGKLKLATEEVHFENLKFGNAHATAQIKDSQFLIDSIFVEHPSGRAELKQISLQQEKPFNFKADLVVQDFQLQKLFKSLNLNDIPADFKASAKSKCSGQLESLKIHCDSQILANDISVQTDFKSAFHIIQIDQAEIQGETDLTLNSVKFKSNLRLGKSNIQNSGDVDFEHGFSMKLSSKLLDLSEIKNIANLGLKGFASGELSTSGTASFGIIDSNLQINNLIIDHFLLGQVQTHLKYAKEQLSFLNTSAKLNKSIYTGNVEIDFSKSDSEIQGHLNLNPLYLNDVLLAIEDRWHLPITADGKGSGEIEFSGPLNFWQMSYNLKSEFQRGQIMNENFIKLTSDIQSNGEMINFKNFVFHKPNGSVRISNHIVTTPQNETPRLNLQVQSSSLKIEDFDHFSELFPTANGQLILNGSITSNILSPLVKLQIQSKDLKIDNTLFPNSQGDTEITLDYLKFSGQIFGRQLQLDMTVPFKNKEKFSIKAQARDLNPLVLLPMFNLQLPPSDTYAAISGDVDLKSDNASKITGQISVENILLQRSSQSMKLKKPSTITFNRGLEKMDPLVLSGPDQNINIALKNNSNSELLIDGRFFLRPLQFLVPFLDNLSGIAEISCLIDLKSSKLNLSGEGMIDNASMTMKGFKYPISDLTTYFDFSKSKIIFTELNASLNQTSISGEGQIDIKGPKNIDVLLTAESEKIDLEFPPKYQTSGFAQIKFYGQWLPYNLKIDYLIDEGNITKEFTDDDENTLFSLRPSPFLPEQQLSQKNQSLILEVNADFSKGVSVKNRLVEGVATGKIHVTGSPENPILHGRVDVQQGSRLIFKDKPFDIQLGYITFGGEYVLNPIINMTANARVSDYDINLQIQGPAKNLDIKPTSQPSLSREDIISLLALGYTASKNDQLVSSDVQQKQTGLEVLAALSNQSQLNKKLQQKLGLNVQLSPSIDSTRNIAVPKVTVSKKLNSKVTTSYSRPLTGDQQENEIRLQYLWSKNLSLILNYQNQGTDQQTNILQNNKTETGVGGIDFEFKKEFGE